MGYSMTRAIPMAVIGFVLGAALVVLLRGLQSMTEVWSPQLGLTMGGLFATIFFLWGIGGLSGKMAAHEVHEPEEDEFGNELPVEDHHHHGEEKPADILQEQVWVVAFWISVLVIGVFAFAAIPGGFGYVLSSDPAANVNAIGYFELELFGQTLIVSQLFAFVLVVAFTMFSLFVAAWLIAQALFGLNRGIKTVKVVGNQPLTALPEAAPAGLLEAGEGAEVGRTIKVAPQAPNVSFWRVIKALGLIIVLAVVFNFTIVGWFVPNESERLMVSLLSAVAVSILVFFGDVLLWVIRLLLMDVRKLVIALVTGFILYQLFYHALVGWIIPGEPTRTAASVTNAILIPIVIFYPKALLWSIGYTARFFVWVLRGMPWFFGQR